ncbi:hypothetical protein DPEC_G00108860 [Dallia pectoralis]|uniref:Uncharacterized protein n=1 Tax=Dallia pectoralis TaxID=75939 RepID=A0ACC2GT27_DALPE|nr:hypothetical protein DPEC_G00108860 [Dallia pectoralis]
MQEQAADTCPSRGRGTRATTPHPPRMNGLMRKRSRTREVHEMHCQERSKEDPRAVTVVATVQEAVKKESELSEAKLRADRQSTQ